MQRSQETQSTIPDDAVLFDCYGGIIFAYVCVHTLNSEDAEDLTLEVFIAAYERDNLSSLSNGSEQLAWLKRVAHNKLIDYYRKAKRHPTTSLEPLAETMLDEEFVPEEHVLQQEQHRELRNFVSRLPRYQQQILHLRYGESLNCSEIATLLNKKDGAVRQVLSRTIKLLRSMYQHQVHGEGEDA